MSFASELKIVCKDGKLISFSRSIQVDSKRNEWARWFALLISTFFIASFISTSVFAQSTSPAKMADYWTGGAQWEFQRAWSGQGATHIEFYNGNWYQFERYASAGAEGTQIRRSTDRGATWSTPVPAIVPTPGTPWARSATDGDAIYDAANNKWRLLFQCRGEEGPWNGCYAERAGADPMGSFTPVAGNPVIRARALWDKICDTPQDDCSVLAGGAGRVQDEGTFNIFNFDGAYFWVSFHGYDGVRGYRGIAKTQNFVTWIAGDASQGLPADAVVDRNDALNWRESWSSGGPIGAGAGSILLESGYYYLATEIADVNLSCTVGQHWDWGLFRTATLTSSTWEQLPQGNPFIYSTRTADAASGGQIPPCSVAYAQLFKDPLDNAIYLKHFRLGTGKTYLYKLVKSANVLKNGDLWMGSGNYWQRFPIGPTNLVVYRNPANASDGNQYLATNCGTYPQPCQAGQGIYQDVNVAGLKGYWLTFGGNFSTEAGSGALQLAAHQLDSSHRILKSNKISIPATPTYQHVQSTAVPIVPETTTLRYQAYLGASSITFRADEMFANVTPSVSSCSMGMSWNQNDPTVGHVIGRADADGWSANTGQDAQGYLQFGPYISTLSASSHVAKWMLLIDNNFADNERVVRVEVSDYTSGDVIASREITRTQWAVPMQYGCFALPFTLDASRVNHLLEFRVFWYDRAYVRGQLVGID